MTLLPLCEQASSPEVPRVRNKNGDRKQEWKPKRSSWSSKVRLKFPSGAAHRFDHHEKVPILTLHPVLPSLPHLQK